MMNYKIGYFPRPYPDELLHSLIARYISHTGSKSYLAIKDLFGRNLSLCFHLPNSLNKLIERASPVIRFDIDELINKHTLFDFFTSFGSISRKEAMYKFLAFGEGKFVVNQIEGLELGKLKYCVLCAKEDISQYGETYWHRSHNLPEVLACYKHNCQLEVFNSNTSNLYKSTFLLADKIIDLSSEIKRATQDQIFIARSFDEILNSQSRLIEKIHSKANSKELLSLRNGKTYFLKKR